MSTRTQLKNHHEIRVIFQRMALEIAESFADQEEASDRRYQGKINRSS